MSSLGAASDPSCPHCRTASVTAQGAVPWCPRCEWNLDHFEPARRSPEFGWTWVDRLTHRVAYRLTARQFTALVSGPLERPSWSVARLVTSGVSLVVLALMVALAVAG
ncbi:MAG TPA: peptidase M48, partial [Catenuloplanes sp.]